MSEQAKRGFMPTDRRDFGEKALPLLRKAAQEVYFLINRGYPVTSTTRFVGDRYQFSERQRLALARVVSPEESIASRKSREAAEIGGQTIYIDGFNVLIGLEIAFSDSMLFLCPDGTVRDLGGLHGTYRLIPQTDMAIKALTGALRELGAAKAVIYLDKPVSNSGRLRQRIYELSEGSGLDIEVCVEEQVDTILKGKPLIASGDAIILDECDRWFSLEKEVIRRQIGEYPYIELL